MKRAPSLPQPFGDMVQHAVLGFSSDVVTSAHATLSQALKEVTQASPRSRAILLRHFETHTLPPRRRRARS